MMKQKADHKSLKAAIAGGLLAGLVMVAGASDTEAANKVKGQYATSKSPMYSVGNMNSKLSRLCRMGLFKQRKLLRLSIGYIGPNGQGVTGIAKKGWNLYDPTGAAEDEFTYHFFNQGYSNCRVYQAETRNNN